MLLIAGSMAAKDVAYNIATYLVSRQHGLTAGLADGLGDVASAVSFGGTFLTFAHGVTGETFAAFGALLLGSVIGGVLGTRLGVLLSNRLDDPTHGEVSADSH